MIGKGYVRLKAGYVLRGWQKLPYALVRTSDGRPTSLSRGTFRACELCNGRLTADTLTVLGVSRDRLQELDDLGVLEYLAEPGHLEPDQAYRLFDNRYLRLVHLSLTGRCNLRCRHCYMSAPHAMLPQPPLERCLEVIDQIADCGVMTVSLTGGEPLVRPDFLTIVDRILERGMRIQTIMTNGSLVDERLLDELEARECRPELNMSYDGPRRIHDWLRGVNGAHDSVIRAFTLCRDRGFATGAELVLHRGNIDTLRESVQALGGLGVRSLKVNRLSCVGEGAALTDHALTVDEEFEAYLDYIPSYLEDGMPVPHLMLSSVFLALDGRLMIPGERHPEDADCGNAPICTSARTTMYLGPDGRILPCIPMSETEASSERFPLVGEMTLAEALTDSSYLRFITTTLDEYLKHNPQCAACEYRRRCGGGCRGRAVVEGAGTDLLAVDPDACRLYRGGYYERIKKLIEDVSAPA